MIIGENFNNDYDGYGEENYDYLFKRKSPEQRQQKKANKKNHPGPLKRKFREGKAGVMGLKKKLIQGNFGLFNKNKKKEEEAAAAAATPDVNAQTDTDNTPAAAPVDEANQNPAVNTDTGANNNGGGNAEETPPPAENPDTSDAPESEYDEPAGTAKSDTKTPEKGKETKEPSYGVWLGWAFLGLTVIAVGYTLYSLDKMEAKLTPNDKLHSNI